MDVSVAICTWNRSTLLRQTLERLTQLEVGNIEWELLVVNNNCTDDTDALCRSFEGRLPIRTLHETTPGQANARNLAIREARGTVIAWTDDDVLAGANWLTALLEPFKRDDAAWVFGASDPEWPSQAPSWYSDRLRGCFAVLDYGPDPFVVTDLQHPFYGLNFAGLRSAHVSLNGFRKEFGFRGNEGGIGEDIDMFERAFRAGMRIVYTPHARVRHIIAPDRLEKKYHRRRQWVAGPIYYRHLDELFPTVPWLLGLPRFFYPKALQEALGFVRGIIALDASECFYRELQLLKFFRLGTEAARLGFQKKPA